MTTVAVPLLGTDATPHVYGSRLCLALVNSLWWRRSRAPIEQLNEYADLVTTVARAGWLSDSMRSAIEARAATRAAEARRELAAAIDLRETLHEAFAAFAAGAAPVPELLTRIQAGASPGLGELDLQAAPDGGYTMAWTRPALDVPIHQAAVSAVLLLVSGELDRVKQCPGSTCGWVFVDSSRNRSRRWCDSRECGNRERVRAHYQRSHAAS